MASEARSIDPSTALFVGTHGHVVALAKSDGAVIWDTSLPGTGYSVVSLVFEEGRLFCGTGGKVFALDPENGRILWTNALPGLGTGLIYLSTAQSNDTEAVLALLAKAQADSRAAATAAGAS